MKPALTGVGIALIIAGCFLIFRGASFTSRENVLEVGGLTVSAQERRAISPRTGAVVLIGYRARHRRGAPMSVTASDYPARQRYAQADG
jgi:hypothetical protein